jgi:hypothetical protein
MRFPDTLTASARYAYRAIRRALDEVDHRAKATKV